MNCQEFSRLVVGNPPNSSAARHSEAMEAHLRQCDPCRLEWESWREIAALEIPATPEGLGSRILEAISRTQQKPRRHFRPFLVGGGVLGCLAAAAAIVAWKTSSGPADQLALAPAESSGPQVSQSIAPEPVGPEPQPASDEEAPLVAAATEMPAANALRFLVVFRPETGADASAVAAASQCHDTVVNHLRAVPEFEVIAPGTPAFAPASRFGLSDADKRTAREQGAGQVLVISTEMGCGASLLDARTGVPIYGAAGGQLSPTESFGPSAANLTQQIREKFLFTPEALWAEARRKVLDTTLPERERADTLWSFSNYRQMSPSLARRPLDSEVIAAAAQLATTSADAEIRESIWAVLRGTPDKQVVQPLLKALANDPVSSIRMQAAFSLRPFLDEPGVREALLRAAAEDADSVPEVVCCLYTVREAAERAAVPDSRFREWVLGRLYDESVPVRSRLRVLAPSLDGRFLSLSDVEFGAEAARVVFDLGRQSQDPGIRLMAWDILRSARPDASFIPQFISDLTNHPDEYVRANAARLLYPHADNAAVAKALEAARTDPSAQVRIAANGEQRPFRP